MENKTLKGICVFHSETGTEGGDWAFQDSKFITKNVQMPYCKKCGKYFEPQESKIKVVKILSLNQDTISGKEPPECQEGQHEPAVHDSWSYEGLHILKNGDRLTIFSKEDPSKVVWSGIIKLGKFTTFTKHVFGMWIHADQKGIKRETWARYFIDEYPAELIPANKP